MARREHEVRRDERAGAQAADVLREDTDDRAVLRVRVPTGDRFLGRLERPFQEIPPGSEALWIRQNPRGRVIQDLKYMPAEVRWAELTQPYRDDVLAVWGREGIPGS